MLWQLFAIRETAWASGLGCWISTWSPGVQILLSSSWSIFVSLAMVVDSQLVCLPPGSNLLCKICYFFLDSFVLYTGTWPLKLIHCKHILCIIKGYHHHHHQIPIFFHSNTVFHTTFVPTPKWLNNFFMMLPRKGDRHKETIKEGSTNKRQNDINIYN